MSKSHQSKRKAQESHKSDAAASDAQMLEPVSDLNHELASMNVGMVSLLVSLEDIADIALLDLGRAHRGLRADHSQPRVRAQHH